MVCYTKQRNPSRDDCSPTSDWQQIQVTKTRHSLLIKNRMSVPYQLTTGVALHNGNQSSPQATRHHAKRPSPQPFSRLATASGELASYQRHLSSLYGLELSRDFFFLFSIF